MALGPKGGIQCSSHPEVNLSAFCQLLTFSTAVFKVESGVVGGTYRMVPLGRGLRSCSGDLL